MLVMVIIMKNNEYLKNEKSKILDAEKWATYVANYKQANSKSKTYTSISKQATYIIDSLESGRVTNKDIDTLKTFANYMLKNKQDIEKINNFNDLDFKKQLVEIYNSTKKLGVEKTRNDDTITRRVVLKSATGVATIRTMLVLLFSNECFEKLPPKKDKAKKTIKGKK